MKWTQFWDMHSGGRCKLQWEELYIEAPLEQATRIFQFIFNRDPNNVSCECCGGDYAIQEYDTLERATEYLRREQSVEDYLKKKYVRIIFEKDFSKNILLNESDLL